MGGIQRNCWKDSSKQMLGPRLTGTLDVQSVGIAFLKGGGLNASRTISAMDRAHRIPENLVSGDSMPFSSMGSFEVRSDGLMAVLGVDIRSSRIIVTNRALGRPGAFKPQPLFYRYKIGRGKYAVYLTPEIDVLSSDYIDFLSRLNNFEIIPESQWKYMTAIETAAYASMKLIVRGRGDATIGWQVADFRPAVMDRGSQLFGRCFNAELYLSERNSKGGTFVLSYNGADLATGGQVVRQEVANADPIWEVVESRVSGGEQSIKVKMNDRLADVLD